MGVPPVQFERRSRPPGAPDPAAQTSMLTTWAPHLGSRHDPIRTWLGLLRHGGTSQFSPMPNPTNPTNVTNHFRTHRQSATQPASSTAATCTGARVVPPRATTTQTRRHQQLVLCPPPPRGCLAAPPGCGTPMGITRFCRDRVATPCATTAGGSPDPVAAAPPHTGNSATHRSSNRHTPPASRGTVDHTPGKSRLLVAHRSTDPLHMGI